MRVVALVVDDGKRRVRKVDCRHLAHHVPENERRDGCELGSRIPRHS